MAEAAHVTELQAVDFAVGGVIAGAYEGLAHSGTKAYVRFLQRETQHKIWRCENENLQSLLQRIAAKMQSPGGEQDKPLPDLPVVAYYRAPGLSGSEERPVSFSRSRYNDSLTQRMILSAVPVMLAYTMAFVAWDKPTLDKLTVAWWAYIGHLGRRHSRFIVKYAFEGEIIDIPAYMAGTRDILTEDAAANQAEGRLWAARTSLVVNTQVLYGRNVPDDPIRIAYGSELKR